MRDKASNKSLLNYLSPKTQPPSDDPDNKHGAVEWGRIDGGDARGRKNPPSLRIAKYANAVTGRRVA